MKRKKDQVSVLAYTYPNARITNQDITNFNVQYPTLEVKRSTAFHDRFLILDEKEGYHIKDAGKKCFAINRIHVCALCSGKRALKHRKACTR